MRRLTGPLTGAVAGDIYPTEFMAGDLCPPELEAAALAMDVLGDEVEPDAATEAEAAAKAEAEAAEAAEMAPAKRGR